jgi:hypothetical protein
MKLGVNILRLEATRAPRLSYFLPSAELVQQSINIWYESSTSDNYSGVLTFFYLMTIRFATEH